MEVKIINLNVWLGGKLMKNIISFLTQENVDILNLQEVFKSASPNSNEMDQTEETLGVLGYKYSYYSPAFFDLERNADSGNLILSKYPIVNNGSKFLFGEYFIYKHGQNPKYFPTIPRVIQHAEIDINGKIINNFNVHGIWAHRDGSDNSSRLRMSEIIVKQIKDKKNVILTGDFNTQEDTLSIGNIEKHLINIFKGERITSFNMKQKTDPGYGNAVVDFIFFSPDINLISKSMPDVDISDHLPLIAKFAL